MYTWIIGLINCKEAIRLFLVDEIIVGVWLIVDLVECFHIKAGSVFFYG